MVRYIDLHMHTNFSDGTAGASEILTMVRERNLAAFAVTDHDTMEGYRAVKAMLVDNDPELVSGVELSVLLGTDDVHMLAYLFDPDNRELDTALNDFRKKREKRGEEIVRRLQSLGLKISFAEVMAEATGSVVGRPHIAQAMHRLKLVSAYQEAFDRYIKTGGPAYVPKVMMAPQEAIKLVHDAGGLAVLAHPFIDDMAKHVETLAEMGLDGIEVRHSAHTTNDRTRLEKIADQHGLLKTGGSDYHGREGRYGMIGSQKVPASYLDKMKDKAWRTRNLD